MPGRERVRPPKSRQQHGALADDIHADRLVVAGENHMRRRTKQRLYARFDDEERAGGDIDNIAEAGMLPPQMAKKILRQSKMAQNSRSQQQQQQSSKLRPSADGQQQGDDDDDDGNDDDQLIDEAGDDDDGEDFGGIEYDDGEAQMYNEDSANPKRGAAKRGGNDDEEDEEVELEYDDNESMTESEAMQFEEFADLGDYNLDEEETRLLGKFGPQAPTQSRNLADIIMEKIREKEEGGKEAAAAERSTTRSGAGGPGGQHVDNRVRRVYAAIGRVLRSYTAGKIPKAFKILPRVQNWEQLILLTKPEEWSPHATYAATRIFAAALNERMAQRFYSAILLPIVHDHIMAHKHLHPSLYQALRKALFKPIAFYKGFLLPLCAGGECSLREAMIVSSVLQKCHLHAIPTAVVIVKICEFGFNSPNVLFLRVLIDKKLDLPYQAVDAMVAFFHRFAKAHGRTEKLPVLWHQALLSFCQRYKDNFKAEQIALLHEVCNKHFHMLITPETRRELASAKAKLQA